MDETIDLRPYVDAIVRRWWVILGSIVGFILLAVTLYLSQNEYRANALIAVTDPAQRLQFDSRIVSTLNVANLLQAYPEIASSDGVMTTLLEEARGLSNNNIDSLPALRSIIDVETGADGRLVRLVVRHNNPQIAADIANAWARIFVNVVDSIYVPAGGGVEFFRDQLSQTETDLQTVEKALVDFQSGSRIAIVENELAALKDRQSTYLAEKNRLLLTMDNIRSLQGQIAAGSGDTIPWADQLVSLMLQLKMYETETTSETVLPESPLQLQLSAQNNLTTEQRNEQLALLSILATTAETRLSEIDVKLIGLESDIFNLQQEQQDLTNRYDQLTRDRDIAKETYSTLARKIDEVRIQTEDSTTGLKVASLATAPLEPDRANLFVTVGIAGMVGLLLSVAALIAITWWRTGPGTKA